LINLILVTDAAALALDVLWLPEIGKSKTVEFSIKIKVELRRTLSEILIFDLKTKG